MHDPGVNETAVPRVLSGIGVGLSLVVFGEWLVFARLQLALILNLQNLISLVTGGPFILGLVYGGYRLDRGPLPPDRYPRIAGWCLGTLVVFLFMNLLTMITVPPENAWVLVGWLRWAAGIGGGVGLVIGLIEARAIERERAAERAKLRAEYAKSQRDRLDYLNSLLRHEVLNTAAVIKGNADYLMETHDFEDSIQDHLESITRQVDDMTGVIQDVKVLLETTNQEGDFEEKNLGEVLRDEVAALADKYENVQTDLSVPDEVAVVADDMLPRVFSNLLANAVEHNDTDTPRVWVTVEMAAETVVVHVSDNGPGIPEEQIDALFEREQTMSDTHGLGLYLVRTLADRYGGSVELTETSETGSTFAVELPRADSEPDTPREGVVDPAVADGT